MSLPVWPEALPTPLRRSVQAQRGDTRRQRPIDSGLPGYRRRSSQSATQVQLSVVLDRRGKQIFDAFFADVAKGGTQPFWMPDPLTDGWPLDTPKGVSLVQPGGQPVRAAALMLCLFGDDLPRETLRGMTITVSFSVWKLP